MLVDLPGAKLPSIAHEAVVLGALGVGAGRAAVHTSPAHHRVESDKSTATAYLHSTVGLVPNLARQLLQSQLPAQLAAALQHLLVNLHVVVRGLSAG